MNNKLIMEASQLNNRIKNLKYQYNDMVKNLISTIKNSNDPHLNIFGMLTDLHNKYNTIRHDKSYLYLIEQHPDMEFFYLGRYEFLSPGYIAGYTESVKNLTTNVSLFSIGTFVDNNRYDSYYYAVPYVYLNGVEVYGCYPLTFKIMPCRAEMRNVKDSEIYPCWATEMLKFGFPSYIITETQRQIDKCRDSTAGGLAEVGELLLSIFG